MTDIIECIEQLSANINDTFNQEIGVKRSLEREITETDKQIETMEKEKKDLEVEKRLLEKASDKGKKEACLITSKIVNKALSFIFDEKICFEAELKYPGGVPHASFLTEVERNGYKVKRDPVSSGGLGVVDAISIALRTAYLNIVDKENHAPMFFDEPGKFVSSGFIRRVAEFLKETSRSTNRQMFLCTHEEEISQIGDHYYRVSLVDGKSIVEERKQEVEAA